MAQHDYDIANQDGAATRADINAALAAIVSQNSGATEPAETFPYMSWADTTAGKLKLRNAADSAWITVLDLASGLNLDLISQAEAEAGSATTARSWSAQRVKQAIAALAAGGMAFSGISGYSANQTLTTAAYGRFIYLSGTMTLTLPVADAGNVGKVITAHCYTTGVITVATQSSQNLYYKGSATTTNAVVMGPGDKMQFVNIDGSQWMAVGPCGVGNAQTWQDVSGSRVYGTTYYNTTGRPIMLSGTIANTSAGAISCAVGGVVLWNFNGSGGGTLYVVDSVIIPPGASYLITAPTSTVSKWTELR